MLSEQGRWEIGNLDLNRDSIACTRLDEFHDRDIALHFLTSDGIACHRYLLQARIIRDTLAD